MLSFLVLVVTLLSFGEGKCRYFRSNNETKRFYYAPDKCLNIRTTDITTSYIYECSYDETSGISTVIYKTYTQSDCGGTSTVVRTWDTSNGTVDAYCGLTSKDQECYAKFRQFPNQNNDTNTTCAENSWDTVTDDYIEWALVTDKCADFGAFDSLQIKCNDNRFRTKFWLIGSCPSIFTPDDQVTYYSEDCTRTASESSNDTITLEFLPKRDYYQMIECIERDNANSTNILLAILIGVITLIFV